MSDYQLSDSEIEAMAPPPPTGIAAIARGELAEQVETARRFPRSETRFVKRARAMACLSEDTALACAYAKPTSEGPKTGPSVRFAEILFNTWGNAAVGARVIDMTGDFVVVQGVFFDMQENTKLAVDVARSIVGSAAKGSRRYSQDMIATTTSAALAIARRNAIFAGVPKALWLPIYNESRLVALGDIQTLSTRRTKAIETFSKMGVAPERVYEVLGVSGIDAMTLDDVLQLRVILQQIRDEENPANVDTFFPPPTKPGNADALNEKLAEAEREEAAATDNPPFNPVSPDPESQPPKDEGKQPKQRRTQKKPEAEPAPAPEAQPPAADPGEEAPLPAAPSPDQFNLE